MELKSLKKKYKAKGFAAGCSREVIARGAEQLDWELPKLLEMNTAGNGGIRRHDQCGDGAIEAEK